MSEIAWVQLRPKICHLLNYAWSAIQQDFRSLCTIASRRENIYIPSFSCIHTNKNFTSIVNKKVLIVYFLNLNEKDTQSKCSKTLQNDVNPEKSIYSTNFIVVEYFPHKVS